MGLKEAAALRRGGRLAEAEAECRRALASNPWDARACHLLGAVLHERGRSSDAVELFRRAVALAPDVPELHVNFAAMLGKAGKLDEAIEHLTRAVRLRGDIPELHNNLGVTLETLGRLEASAAAYRTAIALRADYVEAHCNLGNALRKLGRFREAMAEYERAIELRDSYGNAHAGLSDAWGEVGDAERALAERRRAVERTPDRPEVHSDLVYALHYSTRVSPRQRLRDARQWAARHANVRALPAPDNDRTPDRTSTSSVESRLRVGYLSPDFRAHAMAHLIEPNLRWHDRAGFEVFCYSSVARPDKVTARLRGLADAWRDVSKLDDDQAAAMIRRDRIDILVEVAGHMGGNRLLVLARRPAPAQVQLGYAGTTGLDAVNYRITDPYCDPPGAEQFYSEKLIRLPECAWAYEPSADAPDVGLLPMRSAGFVTFGCLNRIIKVSDEALELWGRILARVAGSRLILLSPAENPFLLERLAAHRVDPARVELVPRASRAEYLRLFNRIDIALDPFPYNGDTTSCDGFWMGVPLVTLAGEAFVSRRGVGLLTNVGLGELVATSGDEYVRIAAELACDPNRLAEIRSTLRERMRDGPLTDGRRYATHLERAYREIWKACCADQI